MSSPMFDKILSHYGHKVAVAIYGAHEAPVNVAIECEDCNEVIYDIDREAEKPLSHCYYWIAFRFLEPNVRRHAIRKGVDELKEDTLFELVSLDELKRGDVFVLGLVINLNGREMLQQTRIDLTDPYQCAYLMATDYPTEGPMYLPYSPLLGWLPAECWARCEAVFNETDHI